MKSIFALALIAASASAFAAAESVPVPLTLASSSNVVEPKTIVAVATQSSGGDVVETKSSLADCAVGFPAVLKYEGFSKVVASVIRQKNEYGDDEGYVLACRANVAKVNVVAQNVQLAAQRLNGYADAKDREALIEAATVAMGADEITVATAYANDVLDRSVQYRFKPIVTRK